MMQTQSTEDEEGYLTGQLLIAMPSIGDPRFERTVIYLCAHSADGAMGLVINKLVDEIDFDELLEQLGVDAEDPHQGMHVHFGGPVETGRGFVLHTTDYRQDSTLVVNDDVALTATIDILRSIAGGKGPRRCLFALGYAGWSAGQLDEEIQANGWLHVPADLPLIFDADVDSKWSQAIQKVGIDVSFLSSDAGHA
jgi:putative transcriptional regulator